MFHLYISGCVGVTVSSLTIISPADSPNTDGIDPSDSQDVHIYNCTISNGDDCVAVKGRCTNVLVENSTFYYGHGASVGSIQNTESVSNITFRNLVLHNTSNGCRIKAYTNSTGIAQNITWSNITLYGVDYCIELQQNYKNKGESESDDAHRHSPSGACLFNDITFENIVGTHCHFAGVFEVWAAFSFTHAVAIDNNLISW